MLFHQGVRWRQEWRLGSSLQNMLPASADGETVERLLHTTLHSRFVVCSMHNAAKSDEVIIYHIGNLFLSMIAQITKYLPTLLRNSQLLKVWQEIHTL